MYLADLVTSFIVAYTVAEDHMVCRRAFAQTNRCHVIRIAITVRMPSTFHRFPPNWMFRRFSSWLIVAYTATKDIKWRPRQQIDIMFCFHQDRCSESATSISGCPTFSSFGAIIHGSRLTFQWKGVFYHGAEWSQGAAARLPANQLDVPHWIQKSEYPVSEKEHTIQTTNVTSKYRNR